MIGFPQGGGTFDLFTDQSHVYTSVKILFCSSFVTALDIPLPIYIFLH